MEIERTVPVDMSVVNIAGFLTFRINELKKFINIIIDELIETIILNKEYSELIKLIKVCILSSFSRIKTLHIVFHADGAISICNQNKKGSVGANRIFCDKDLLVEDFLLDSILDNAPVKIIIHNINYIKSRNLLKTINMLYDKNLEICSGCNKCSYMHLIES